MSMALHDPQLLVDSCGRWLRALAVVRGEQGGWRLAGLWLSSLLIEADAGAVVTGRPGAENREMASCLLDGGAAGLARLDGAEVRQARDRALVVAQITAEAQETPVTARHKPARATLALSFAGRYLVHLPAGRGVKSSRRAGAQAMVADSGMRAALAALGGGWILRQATRDAAMAMILTEARGLAEMAMAALAPATTPGLRLRGPDALAQAYGTLPGDLAPWQVHLAGEAAGAAWSTLERRFGVNHPVRPWNEADAPMPEAFDLAHDLMRLSASVVPFDGGQLVLQPTEALVAVDVDLARRGDLDTALRALVHHIRWRRLSGLIIIDLPRWVDRPAVLARLRQMTADWSPSPTGLGFTASGALELVLRRRYRALHELGSDWFDDEG